MATILRVSFCSLCDADLWCQVSRTLLERYCLFSILTFFSCKPYDVITDLICIIEKCLSNLEMSVSYKCHLGIGVFAECSSSRLIFSLSCNLPCMTSQKNLT